jgi:hypothetical protein
LGLVGSLLCIRARGWRGVELAVDKLRTLRG